MVRDRALQIVHIATMPDITVIDGKIVFIPPSTTLSLNQGKLDINLAPFALVAVERTIFLGLTRVSLLVEEGQRIGIVQAPNRESLEESFTKVRNRELTSILNLIALKVVKKYDAKRGDEKHGFLKSAEKRNDGAEIFVKIDGLTNDEAVPVLSSASDLQVDKDQTGEDDLLRSRPSKTNLVRHFPEPVGSITKGKDGRSHAAVGSNTIGILIDEHGHKIMDANIRTRLVRKPRIHVLLSVGCTDNIRPQVISELALMASALDGRLRRSRETLNLLAEEAIKYFKIESKFSITIIHGNRNPTDESTLSITLKYYFGSRT